MENLLKETLEALEDNGKKEEDVIFVTNGKKAFSWGRFKELAKNLIYDDGYGAVEINTELKIVGRDWWLERGEYDGSEWWDFKTPPERIERCKDMSVTKDDLLEEDNFKDLLK
ncbi:MAG: hypothetical protein IIY81_00915 [Lachnospiraceae bacterium]|nr:hypothetical protein [Lachnospiraceae bacterium]